MKKTDKIYQNIEDELGIHIHQINSDENRHFMGEKIAISIISKIIIEFLIGLIKPKELGENLRKKFNALINKNKEKNKDEIEFKNDVEKFLTDSPNAIFQPENLYKSQEFISNYLISELKLKKDKAESIAFNMCKAIIKDISNENL